MGEVRDEVEVYLLAQSPGAPVPAAVIAEHLDRSVADVVAAGRDLERRQAGDENLFTVVERTVDRGAGEFFLTHVPLALNDEPDQV
ncbi:MAG: hypothetical protein M3O32_11680 [Actinomycetota bacterium]|nr:hypothetical protein [Actinomycetota bacterium]